MNIIITGGTGFIGRHLQRHFLNQAHTVTVIGSRPAPEAHNAVTYVQADTTAPGPWQSAVSQADMVVNLTGRTIFKRWSRRYKKELYDSRIRTTRNIVDALPTEKRAVMISTSAVGYYGDGQDSVLTEAADQGRDFLAVLAGDWEAEAFRAREKGARIMVVRFGIVLGRDGGALATMLPTFRSGLGGPLGSGRQWFPWIHIDDLIAALDFLWRQQGLAGTFNLCSPNPVTHREFVKTLGRLMGKPAILPAPAFAMKLALGEMASVLLAGQRALPAKLLDSGFQFKYPSLDDALADLLS